MAGHSAVYPALWRYFSCFILSTNIVYFLFSHLKNGSIK
ncbi:hypothetical protein NT01EI_2826 [Edwardsiella ictaluri 93-146]|uniref:Uncharacterized protein n=1 Tax=Edwardsiella ictaluri (strain 93-146) TaxID=634503 RepID=C5BEJ3_EDWI9|nr:hypothetical protein NT01EI_2826 [Edwardsiella ictaluri 93-146]